MNAAHVLNQRIAKSFCFPPLTDVLTRKSNALPRGPHFGSNSPLYGASRESNARGLPGGGRAVLELTGTLLHFELTFLLHYASMLSHFASVLHLRRSLLHFALLLYFVGMIAFCGETCQTHTEHFLARGRSRITTSMKTSI